MLRMPRSHVDEAWEELGPANIGGRTRVIRFHPNNPNIMFAGSVSGGLWKSTDAGNIWVPITDFLPNLAVGAFEFDPLHPDTMYLGTGEGNYNIDAVLGIGLLKSTDGGNTWEQTSLSFPYSSSSAINKISVDPTNPLNIVVATRSGLRRTTDGGVSFTYPTGSGAGDFKDVQRDPQNPNTLLAAAGYPWSVLSRPVLLCRLVLGVPCGLFSSTYPWCYLWPQIHRRRGAAQGGQTFLSFVARFHFLLLR